MAPNDDDLRGSIVDFLTSNSRAGEPLPCPKCGSARHSQTTTFFYDGQRWDVLLPVCLKCPTLPHPPPSHDA